MLGFVSMTWGLVLLLPFKTFATSQGYAMLKGFATEPVTGLVVAAIGFVNLHSLIAERWWLHRKSAIALMMFWMLATIVFFVSAPASATWSLYAGLAILHAWSAAIGPDAHS